MRLVLTRAGGFAGITKPPLVLETDELPSADAQRIRHLVDSAGFFLLPSELVPDRVDPDSFSYTLTIVSENGQEHSVSFTDRSMQTTLRELVSNIRKLANTL
jgi:hypothetical protein